MTALDTMTPSTARSDFPTTPSSKSKTASPVISRTMSPSTTGSQWATSPAPASQSALEDVRRTRMFVISDTHSLPWSAPKGHFDLVVCLGDHTDRSTKREFEEFIETVRQIDTDHVFLIFGNHEFSTDSSLPESKYPRFSYARLQRWEKYLTKEYALQLCRDNGIILLDEGRHEFHLKNGTTAKIYASPYTPKRKSPYHGYRYKRRERDGKPGHEFNIDPDIDFVFTHGPPEGILDHYGLTTSRRGCKDLLEAVASARPRVHCFGHNHAGWGATFVDWEQETGDRRLLGIGLANECNPGLGLNKATKFDLVEGKDLASWKQKDAESSDPVGCCRLNHSSQNQHPIQKGSTTLFVNAAYSGIDSNSEGENDTQMPMIVELDLPLTVGSVAEGKGIRASLKKSPTRQNTLVPSRTLVTGQAGAWTPPHKRQISTDNATSAMQTLSLSDATRTKPAAPARVPSPRSEQAPIESDADEVEETGIASLHDHSSRPEGNTTRCFSSGDRSTPIQTADLRQGRAGAWGVVGAEKHKYQPFTGSRATCNKDKRTHTKSKPSTTSSRPGLRMQSTSSQLSDSQAKSNRSDSTEALEKLVQRDEGQPNADNANHDRRRWTDLDAAKSKSGSDRPKKTGHRGAYGFSKSKSQPDHRVMEGRWK